MSRVAVSSGVETESEGRSGVLEPAGPDTEPCLRCGILLPLRLMGCKGGHCPNCRHPYPHGDCSD